MSDQADKLRKMVKKQTGSESPAAGDSVADAISAAGAASIFIAPGVSDAAGVSGTARQARVITVTSGKGGVGKTNVTVNLALALSKMGLRVVILDVDFGLANIDVLFGIIPKYTLLDIIHGEKSIFEVLTDGPNNIKFLSGGSGVEELIRLDRKQLRKFISNISLLDKLFDVILIDTGAGLSQNVMSFIMAADDILLVTTPEPTAITDAYALIKMVSKRERRKKIHILINKADSAKEAEDIANKISVVSEKFLALKLLKVGYILYDDNVTKSVKMQKPFSLYNPKCEAAKNITEIAEKMFAKTPAESTAGATGFISKLLSFFGV